MATITEADHTAVNGSDKELPTEEEAAEEQTAERRHVDALLDISEEDFMKELEPFEYNCYSGWEEAVRGWARVAPLSCILTQDRYRKPKQADNATPVSADPTIPDATSSASIAEHCCESHVSLKKSTPLNQHTGSWGNTAEAALQKDGPEWPVLHSMQKTMPNVQLKDGMEEEGALRDRPAKPQKHSRLNNIVVPIKNFTFLPPIKSEHPNPKKVSDQLCSGKKAPEGETIEENGFIFVKKSGTRGTRVDPIANTDIPTALSSKYRTCQHNPHLFSAVSVSVQKRYQVPASSRSDTVHHARYSMAKSLTQALHTATAAGAQAQMYPSKSV